MLDKMNNHEIILDPVLRRAAASELEYWYKSMQTVHTADPSHIYTYSCWPLKVELFKDKHKELGKNEQIPTEYNEEKTLRVLRKQNKISGEGRVKTISDIPKTAALGQILKDLKFPADKNTILQFIENSSDPQSNDAEILSIIKKINNMLYKNVAEVIKACNLVNG